MDGSDEGMNCRNRRWLWALLFLLVAMQGCWRSTETVKRRYVASGDKYFAQGKYKEASLMYRSALSKDRKYGEAYAKLGESELRRGELQTALQAFTRAMELLQTDENSPGRLADIWLAYYGSPRGHNEATLKQVESLAKELLKRNPNSYNGQRLTGYLQIARAGTDAEHAQAHTDAAIAAFRKADQARPGQPDVLFNLAQTLNRNNQWNEAEPILRRILEKSPQYWLAYDYLILEYWHHKRPQEAEQIMALKVKNDPKNADVVIQQAGFYLALQRKEQAEAVLKSLLAREKELPEARMKVGDFYIRTRDYDRAFTVFSDGAKQGGSRANDYRMKIALVQIATGRKSEGRQTIDSILKDDPKNNSALSMRAGLQLDSGDDKQTQSAINDLQMLLGRQPNNAVIRYNLARAYQTRGDLPAAKIQYQEAAKQPGFLAAQIGLAQVNLVQGDYLHAVQSADDSLKIDSTSILAMAIKANAQINMGNVLQARTDLQKELSRFPNSPDLQYQLALASYKEGKFPEALAAFQKMLEKYPGDARLVFATADVLVQTNRGKEALKLLQEQSTRVPQNQAMRFALANTARRVHELDLAEREYRLLMETQPRNVELLRLLGETVRSKGQPQQAMELFRQGLALEPKNSGLNLGMALAMETVGMKSESYPYYKAALAGQPSDDARAVAMNNVAYLLAEEGHDLDSALTYIQKARQLKPDNDDIADTMGWIYLKRTMNDDALTVFKDLVKRNPGRALFRYHLGAAQYQKHDFQAAKQNLQMALTLKPAKDDEAKIRELLAKIG
jgi:tetratricopeptide (TPR) repeat protein